MKSLASVSLGQLQVLCTVLMVHCCCRANHTDDRHARAGFISFRPVGDEISVGLDLVTPFVKVPLNRQQNGQDTALLNINTAAIAIGGLIAGGGVAISHLFKTLGYMGSEDSDEVDDTPEGTTPPGARRRSADSASDDMILRMLDNFKLIYRTAEGEQIENRVPELLERIQAMFENSDLDMGACVKKAICVSLMRMQRNLRHNRASSLERMIAMVADAVRSSASVFAEPIEAGMHESSALCEIKYALCKIVDPDRRVMNLIETYVRFV